VGATPIAITDNLNFGNPEKLDTMGVIVKAIEGMAEACRVLEFPVVSGNVSLYNETDGVGIPPTPVVGGIGLIEDLDRIATLARAEEGDLVYLVGERCGHLGASLYARVALGLDGATAGAAPQVDLALIKRNADFVRAAICAGEVRGAHDVSDGGPACAIAELALASGRGVITAADQLRRDPNFSAMFGEDQGRFILVVAHDKSHAIESRAATSGCKIDRVGGIGGDRLVIRDDVHHGSGQRDALIDIPLSTLRAAHEGWLPNFMKGGAI